MTEEELRRSAETGAADAADEARPPAGLAEPLLALWWDARGDWGRAHAQAQAAEGDAGADLVHAYLHRKEGDLANADHWYRRAGRPRPPSAMSLDEEWAAIARELLRRAPSR
jgi:hypothetical protein